MTGCAAWPPATCAESARITRSSLTALVHEAYLKLIDERRVSWQNRAHFYCIASRMMRRVLVDHARNARAWKRDGGCKIPLAPSFIYSEQKPAELMAIDEALGRLAQVDSRQAQVGELRFFGGRSEEEIGEILGISARTVKRDWSVARSWLYAGAQQEVSKDADEKAGSFMNVPAVVVRKKQKSSLSGLLH